MPAQLTWRSAPARLTSATDSVHLGLELGGDDPRAAGQGVVRLYEVSGTGREAGAEAATPRLIASWHGTVHRDEAALATSRLTFELEGATERMRSTVTDPARSCSQEVEGFDPECMYGVDGVRVSFVNRGFFCFFPFLLDELGEGGFLELQATLEGAGGARLAESHVQSLPLRRTREVLTTTRRPGGARPPIFVRYTGEQVGCTVVHHTEFLVHAASKASGEEWPARVEPVLTPLPLGRGGFDVAPYDAARPLTVLLDVGLAAGHVPDAGWLGRNGQGATAEQVQGWVQEAAAAHTAELLVDAGFVGARALWSVEAGERWSGFMASFVQVSRRGGLDGAPPGWQLREGREAVEVDFWTFHAVADVALPDGALGLSSGTEFVDGGRVGGRDWLLPYARPIGSGTKRVVSPIRILPSLASAVLQRGRRGEERTFPDVQALEARARVMGRKLALIIAHEVAHSLGLMHDALIRDGAPYEEATAKPLASVMCSAAEEGTFGLDMTFSLQAKRIWQEAFGVTPNLEAPHLRNKVWTDDRRRTTSWEDRRHAFNERAGEAVGVGFSPIRFDLVPPFCSLEAPQRGTHVAGA